MIGKGLDNPPSGEENCLDSQATRLTPKEVAQRAKGKLFPRDERESDNLRTWYLLNAMRYSKQGAGSGRPALTFMALDATPKG